MSSDLIKHTSDASFDTDVLQSEKPVLVDYWAEWCGPCKTIAPLLDDLAKVYDGRLQVAKMNVDENRDIPANADPAFYDLGLCGPLRSDLKNRPEYCGLFRTPSLRNVALRQSYFHNGVFHSLREVLDFYVTRDISPQKWYARSKDGTMAKFDDLPSQYHKNVNTEPPFAPLPGNQPRLSPAEIKDIIAFLTTLTDGYALHPANKRVAFKN